MFMEVHHDPPNALSDANTVLDIKYFEVVLAQVKPYTTSEENCKQNGEMTMSTLNNHHSDLVVAAVMLPIEKP